MGTLHSLADRVPASRLHGDAPRPAADPEEAAHWKLLAGRAGAVLSALEAAAADGGTDGLADLAAEVAGLRYALDTAAGRQIAVAAVAYGGYRIGLAEGQRSKGRSR